MSLTALLITACSEGANSANTAGSTRGPTLADSAEGEALMWQCAQGGANTCFTLGLEEENRTGIDGLAGEAYYTAISKSVAKKLYLMAALDGHTRAQFRLGNLLAGPPGQPSGSIREARRWLERAADKGHEGAIMRLEALYPRTPLRLTANDLPVPPEPEPSVAPIISMGDETAALQITAFMSYSCPQCADIHSEFIAPELLDDISAGHAQLVVRELPGEPAEEAAILGAILGRCIHQVKGDTAFIAFSGRLYDSQAEWRNDRNPLPEFMEAALESGVSLGELDDCRRRRSIVQSILQNKKTAENDHDTDKAPILLLNGTRLPSTAPESIKAVYAMARTRYLETGIAPKQSPSPQTETPPARTPSTTDPLILSRNTVIVFDACFQKIRRSKECISGISNDQLTELIVKAASESITLPSGEGDAISLPGFPPAQLQRVAQLESEARRAYTSGDITGAAHDKRRKEIGEQISNAANSGNVVAQIALATHFLNGFLYTSEGTQQDLADQAYFWNRVAAHQSGRILDTMFQPNGARRKPMDDAIKTYFVDQLEQQAETLRPILSSQARERVETEAAAWRPVAPALDEIHMREDFQAYYFGHIMTAYETFAGG